MAKHYVRHFQTRRVNGAASVRVRVISCVKKQQQAILANGSETRVCAAEFQVSAQMPDLLQKRWLGTFDPNLYAEYNFIPRIPIPA